ncbi:hypothetical protein FB45DRAFT_1055302 [Roridomyces roridus]|uniref:Uncharacterized protein n=1 Tax=Roridomyces roridus TaxID=1738132 RepID=A0AAD7FRU2_9AGAR|nr:hypothetical protein FB45DRAFT_1055302 [Roridomyces roridus]
MSPPASHLLLSSETLAHRKERLMQEEHKIILKMRAALDEAGDCEPWVVAAPFRAELATFRQSLTKEDQAALNQPANVNKEQRDQREASLGTFNVCL